MSVDLRSNTSFARISVLLMDDAVIKLEHGRTEDRIRRYRYETIESLIIWRRMAWGQVILCALCIALPGVVLLLTQNTVAMFFGVPLFVLGSGLVLWYLYCGYTTIRIIRAGKNYDLAGVFRPGKVRRFRDLLVAYVRNTQATFANAAPAPEPSASVAPEVPPAPVSFELRP